MDLPIPKGSLDHVSYHQHLLSVPMTNYLCWLSVEFIQCETNNLPSAVSEMQRREGGDFNQQQNGQLMSNRSYRPNLFSHLYTLI